MICGYMYVLESVDALLQYIHTDCELKFILSCLMTPLMYRGSQKLKGAPLLGCAGGACRRGQRQPSRHMTITRIFFLNFKCEIPHFGQNM